MNPQIFREYDIRGVAGKDLTEENVYDLGKAIGTLLIRKGCRKNRFGQGLQNIFPLSILQNRPGPDGRWMRFTGYWGMPHPLAEFRHSLFESGRRSDGYGQSQSP